MSDTPCSSERKALNKARRAYNNNRDDFRDSLADARRFHGLIYEATERVNFDPEEPVYERLGEIRDWADGMLACARSRSYATEALLRRIEFIHAPAPISGYCSSMGSAIYKRANAWVKDVELSFELAEAQAVYDACMEQVEEQQQGECGDALPEGDEVPADEGATGSGDTGALIGGAALQLCLAPRSGHGHVGEPCHIRLGQDGACQYHGYRRDTSSMYC